MRHREAAKAAVAISTNRSMYNKVFKRGGAVYIMTNKRKGALYIGVTSNLFVRIYTHRNKLRRDCFTAKYNLVKLVYYESFHSITEAIAREKQLKSGSRLKKVELIEKENPEWQDLSDTIMRE